MSVVIVRLFGLSLLFFACNSVGAGVMYGVAMYIEDQLAEIREKIAAAEQKAGRPAGSVALLAVSKTFPVSDMMHAYADGQRLFGENRLQEAMEKMPAMPGKKPQRRGKRLTLRRGRVLLMQT